MVKSRHSSRFWGLALAAFALYSSCQSTSSGDDASAKELQYEITARLGCVPDSATWTFAGQTGTGKVAAKPGTSTATVITFSLPKPPGSATVTANYWTLSVHTATETLAGSTRTITWKDELGLVLLTRLDSLRKTADSVRYPWNAASVIQVYAKALVDHDTTFKGFPAQRVTSIDTMAVYNAALVYAASKHIPFSILSKSWLLGLDSATAYKLVAKLMAPVGPISAADSLSFFPPYPVRVATPVAVGLLNVGGSAVAVSGLFVGDSGLSAYKVRILQGNLDVSDLFTIATQPTQLDGSQTAWNLATDVRLTLQVKTAPVGSYTLEVSVSDKKSRADTSRAQLTVAPPPDRTGPTITWVAPTSSLLLENADSVLVVKIKATDESGIDSTWIDGKPATKADSVWLRSVTVPANNLGYDLKVSAKDLAGNKTDSVMHVVRRPATIAGAPIVKLLSPASHSGNVLPFDSAILHLSWDINDPAGIDTNSFTVPGASKISHHDSIWSVEFPMAPNGTEIAVALTVKNKAGNASVDHVFALRQRDTIPARIKPLLGTQSRTVRWKDSTITASWSVTDNASYLKVRINGDTITGIQGEFAKSFSVPIGTTVVKIEAIDISNNHSFDSIVVVRLPPKAVSISAGSYHNLALLEDGRIISWGDSSFDVDKVPNEKWSGIYAAGSSNSYAVNQSGKLLFWGHDTNGLGSLPTFSSKIRSLSPGSNHELALLDDGSVVAWGRNFNAQCNVPNNLKKIRQVQTGAYYSLVLQEDSTVRTWGDTAYGENLIPDTLAHVVAIAAGSIHALALKADGTVVAWGSSQGSGAEIVPERLRNVIAISARARVSMALRQNGTVAAWGDNFYGQLNVPDGLIDVTAIGTGNKHAIALTKDGNVVCWGENNRGQCNLPVEVRP